MQEKPFLAGLLPWEIDNLFKKVLDNPVPKFRSRQVCKWINSGVTGFDGMKNLPLPLREELEKKTAVFSSMITAELNDSDGTKKIQLTLDDGVKIEAVILNDGYDRKTACISTQAGCPCACVFCKTGAIGFKRNLTGREMAEQMLFLLGFDPDISNIVIMGMGEPLLNLDELRKATAFFTDSEGLGISKKRITVSTAGIVQGIYSLADNGPDVRLAVSLTSARQEIRDKLMPPAKTNPLPALKQSLLYYQKKTKRRITLEAVLLKGCNTDEAEADAFAQFADNLDVMINLIPWNPVEGFTPLGIELNSPPIIEINRFMESLSRRKLNVTLRMGKGRRIGGACGQLGQ